MCIDDTNAVTLSAGEGGGVTFEDEEGDGRLLRLEGEGKGEG